MLDDSPSELKNYYLLKKHKIKIFLRTVCLINGSKWGPKQQWVLLTLYGQKKHIYNAQYYIYKLNTLMLTQNLILKCYRWPSGKLLLSYNELNIYKSSRGVTFTFLFYRDLQSLIKYVYELLAQSIFHRSWVSASLKTRHRICLISMRDCWERAWFGWSCSCLSDFFPMVFIRNRLLCTPYSTHYNIIVM